MAHPCLWEGFHLNINQRRFVKQNWGRVSISLLLGVPFFPGALGVRIDIPVILVPSIVGNQGKGFLSKLTGQGRVSCHVIGLHGVLLSGLHWVELSLGHTKSCLSMARVFRIFGRFGAASNVCFESSLSTKGVPIEIEAVETYKLSLT